MKKILAVIKKDIILQSRNLNELLYAIAFAIIIIMLFSFTQNSNITVGIEKGLENRIGYIVEIQGIKIDFLNDELIIKTEFHEKDELIELMQNNNYPVIIYTGSDGLTLKMNTRDPQALTAYLLMSRIFNGVTKDNFNTSLVSSADNSIIMMVISLALIFGGASRGSTIIFQEKNDGTLNLLYKSGLNSSSIILSKLIFTLIVMIVILISIGLFGYFTNTINLFSSWINVVWLIYILIPISILGNFIGIVSKTVDESRSLQLILFMPAMLYSTLINLIPDTYHAILRLHPGIAVTQFYERILEGHFDIYLFVAITTVSVVMLVINTLLLRNSAKKR